jgi:Flp pilus assembly protein TadD
MGSKLHAALDAALELDADHAEAHTALGLYHAQVIEKLGATLARLTWRLDPEAAEAHLRTAIRLTPHTPGAWVGLGIGLGMLDARAHAEECVQAFRTAAQMQPADARQALEVNYAHRKSGEAT